MIRGVSLRSSDYVPPPLTVHFRMTRIVRYQPIFNGLKFTLHRARVLNNVVLNEEAGYKREGNSPNFRDFLRLATATNIVLPLYKHKKA